MTSSIGKALRNLTLSTALLLPLAAQAESEPQSMQVGDVVTASATVEGIDAKTRTLTLKGQEGNEFEVVAGDAVANFAQIDEGDVVTVAFYESITLSIDKAGTVPEADAEEAAAGAEPGEKPAGMLAQSVSISASVVTIDRAARVVVLKLPDGSEVAKTVDPAVTLFDQLKVGDVVQARITRAVAVSVDTPE